MERLNMTGEENSTGFVAKLFRVIIDSFCRKPTYNHAIQVAK